MASKKSEKQQASLARFNFTGGAQAKRPLSSDEDTQEKRKKQKTSYEGVRERKFLPQWSEAFPWVEYDDATGIMFCKVCRSYPSKADKGRSFLLFSVSFG